MPSLTARAAKVSPSDSPGSGELFELVLVLFLVVVLDLLAIFRGRGRQRQRGRGDYTFMTSASLCLIWSSMDLTKRSVSFCTSSSTSRNWSSVNPPDALSFFASSMAVRRFERTRT